MTTITDCALFYASKGWQVFPCQPRDKKPLVKWAGEATTNSEKITAWFSHWPNANLGMMTGQRSGVVVLDVDNGHGGSESLLALVAEHGRLPDTPQSLTGGGGIHYLFSHPGVEIRNSAGKLGPGLDIRGDGGYIIVPPSIHPSGRAYAWEMSSLPSKVSLACPPDWLIQMLSSSVPVMAEMSQDGVLYLAGQRNQAMTSLAGTMRRRGMGEPAIYQALLIENEQRCSPPLSQSEVAGVAASVCRYQPKSQPTPTPEADRQRNEIEWLFAGSVYSNPGQAVDECGWIAPEMIADPQVKDFWGRLLACHDVLQAATESGAIKQIINYRSRDGHLPTRDYAAQIARFGYLNRIGALAFDLSGMASKGDVTGAQNIVAVLSGEAPALSREPVNAYDGLAAFLALIDNPDDRIVKTGLPPLDNAIGGLERQTETILAGRPGMGKSTLGWQIARNVAASKKRVLFFSLEMSIANLWGKAACGIAEVRWRDFLAGKNSTDSMNRIVNEIVPNLMETYADRLLIDDGINSSETIWQAVIAKSPDLVIIDHLRLVADRLDNEVIRLGVISQRAKEIAKRANCAVLLLAQLSRAPEHRGQDQKRPQLADLRDSGQIEENADNVLMLYREDYYKTSEKPNRYDPTELLIRKARNDSGAQCVNLIFDLTQQWFYRPEDVGLKTTSINLRDFAV